MVALPICQITLNAQKPLKKPYPDSLVTIGDHIRQKRLDMNLLQSEVAKQIGVSEDTICYWENNRSNPKVHLIPKIIKFLGYVPFKTDGETIGERIKSYRIKSGLSQKKLSKIWGVDETTIRDWENEKHKPSNKLLKRISKMISS